MKRVLLLAAAVLVATAAPARADDASVVAAYDARQATDLPTAARQYLRARRRYDRSGSDRAARAIIRADRKLNRVLKRIGGEVAAQAASSARGGDGRRLALREIRGWRRANQLEIRAVRAIVDGRNAAARRYGSRANRTFGHAVKLGRRAVRAFLGRRWGARRRLGRQTAGTEGEGLLPVTRRVFDESRIPRLSAHSIRRVSSKSRYTRLR